MDSILSSSDLGSNIVLKYSKGMTTVIFLVQNMCVEHGHSQQVDCWFPVPVSESLSVFGSVFTNNPSSSPESLFASCSARGSSSHSSLPSLSRSKSLSSSLSRTARKTSAAVILRFTILYVATRLLLSSTNEKSPPEKL